MPLCFAYGSNLDRPAMRARCPGSRPRGLARLSGHRLAIMREGFLTVVPALRRHVHGLVWDVPLAGMPALDRYEEVSRGLYRKRLLPVITPAGPRQALVYVGADRGPGPPRPGYLEQVLAAARDVGLPEQALGDLAAFLPQTPEVSPRRAAARRAARPTPWAPPDPQADRAAAGWRWEP